MSSAEAYPSSSADAMEPPPFYQVSPAIRTAIDKAFFRPVMLDSSLDYFPERTERSKLADFTYQCTSRTGDEIFGATDMGQSINSERVFINPKESIITLFRGKDDFGGRDIAADAAERVMAKQDEPVDAIRDCNRKASKTDAVICLSAHIRKNERGEKILEVDEIKNAGDFSVLVFDRNGLSVMPDNNGSYILPKKGRIIMLSRGVEYSAEELADMITKHDRQGGLRPAKDVMETFSKRKNTHNQSIAIVDIK